MNRCKACNAELEGNVVRCPYCGEYQGFNIVRRILVFVVIVLFIIVVYLWLTT